ncbi:TetR family transcriptional regulator [Actinocorallia herbida]|uniref:TetR family transcriptional regulator n=1 Tax=Actinocorallia herbida TaxID=58109 RepID=A0A3N1CNP8_9ACTN|nr:TetR/AcrR family transcriptional regulator [Actinocorallia herbida]ROO82949.1 TetR family transcriptional regulator [Actinocorallia herbida]
MPKSPAPETSKRRTRSDFLASRRALLGAVETLLAERRGPHFSLTELAQEAGISTATAYRHFPDVRGALEAYYEQLILGLIEQMNALPDEGDPIARFEAVCLLWVQQGSRWARAAVHIRSWRGFLDRLHDGDPLVRAIHETLAEVLGALWAAGHIAPQPIEYAVLVWETLFDERVIVDLLDTLDWPVERVAAELTQTVLSALRREPPARP